MINYAAVLETASDVARGMVQLHALDIVHSDLKVWTPKGHSAYISVIWF